MAVLKKLKSGVTATWGAPDAPSGAGIIENLTERDVSEKEALPDQNGETVGNAYFDQKKEVNFDLIAADNYTPPAIGDTLEVNGVTVYVENVEKKWANRGWYRLAITGTYYEAMAAEGGGEVGGGD